MLLPPIGLAFALLLVGAGSARAEDCRPIDQTVAAIAADPPRSRADLTDGLRCHFPKDMTFNDASLLLERNQFDLLNDVQSSFWLWPERGEEFVSKRRFAGRSGQGELRITIHTLDRKLTRFAAQYFPLDR